MLTIYSVPEAFSPAECDRILETFRSAPASDARLVGQRENHNFRRADLVWLDDVEGTEWVTDRIVDLVRVANREVFNFDISDIAESPQVARYGAERQGHFVWHSDIGEGQVAAKRKLTMVVQLSEPEAYVGGLLELWPSAEARVAVKDRGSITFFPSYMLHRVTPVTKGERFSMTQWAHGPLFR